MVYKESSVLIVDDEQVVCDVLHDELSDRGYLCTMAFDGNDALTKLAAQDFEVVLLDIRLPGMSGMKVLREIRFNYGNTATIMITAVDDINVAVEAMKLGASDYIVKPFDLDRVNTSIRIALETKQAVDKCSTGMDAVARGVEVKHELLTGYSYIVTQRTIEVARQLGIAEEEIQQWADARARFEFERDRAIVSSLNKLRQNPFARSIIGMTELNVYTRNQGESQN